MATSVKTPLNLHDTLAKVFNSPCYMGIVWDLYHGNTTPKTIADVFYDHLDNQAEFTSIPKPLQLFCHVCMKSIGLPYTFPFPKSPKEAEITHRETLKLMPREMNLLKQSGFFDYAKSLR